MANYIYSKDTVNIDNLVNEITNAGVDSAVLQYINYEEPNILNIYFDGEISEEDITTLSGVVLSHTGDRSYIPEGYMAVANGQGNMDFTNVFDTQSITLSGIAMEYDLFTVSGVLQNQIDSKSNTDHIHDNRYYTEFEVNDLINTTSGTLYQQIGSAGLVECLWQEDLSTSYTNKTSQVLKMSMSVEGVEAGTYKLEWSYEWKRSSKGSDYKSKIIVDDEAIMEHTKRTPHQTSWNDTSGFRFIQLSAGDHDINFYHFGSHNSHHSSTKNLSICLWRV